MQIVSFQLSEGLNEGNRKKQNLTLRSLTEWRHQGEFFVTATNLRQIISSLNHCIAHIVRANTFLLMQVKPEAEHL